MHSIPLPVACLPPPRLKQQPSSNFREAIVARSFELEVDMVGDRALP